MRALRPHQKLARVNSSILCLLFFAQGCGLFGGITYYDTTTYKNLTENKAEVVSLYESFTEAKVDSAAVRSVKLKLSKMYEYEKGKGSKNQETVKQIEIIRETFERHVSERLQQGRWSDTNMQNKAENISEAFDIAIQTEALKNKAE